MQIPWEASWKEKLMSFICCARGSAVVVDAEEAGLAVKLCVLLEASMAVLGYVITIFNPLLQEAENVSSRRDLSHTVHRDY